MNENIDLTKILKDCPKGTKFYSTIFGEVEVAICNNDKDYPIVLFDTTIKKNIETRLCRLTKYGKYSTQFDGECILFPSKDQRDWSKFSAPWYKKEKFDPKTLQPFDKVLLTNENYKWNCGLVSHIENERIYLTTGGYVYYCIPFNDDTKHLIGTTNEAPEYYKYWED